MSEELYIGVEIGGTKIQCVVGTPAGELKHAERFGVDLAEGAEGIRRELSKRVPRLCGRFPVRAVGVGFGGPVQSARGKTIISHQVEGWKDFPLREWFEELTGLPAVVENDSNCAGWAEYRLGAGRGCGSMVYMNIGSGIGGALVLEGRLFNGQGFGAGEIGHTWVPLPEGGTSRLEDAASGWAFVRRLRRTYPLEKGGILADLCEGVRERIDGPTAAQAALKGDPWAAEAFLREAEIVGFALANVITLLCPEVVVVGGGLALAGSVLLDPLREVVARRVIRAFSGCYRISESLLREHSVTKGALLLAAERSG